MSKVRFDSMITISKLFKHGEQEPFAINLAIKIIIKPKISISQIQFANYLVLAKLKMQCIALLWFITQ